MDKESSVIDNILNSKYKYVQSDCFEMCFINDILYEKCKCSNDIYGSIYNMESNLTSCSSGISEALCIAKEYSTFMSTNVKEKCDYCPEVCEETSFSFDISNANYLTENRANQLVKDPKIFSKFPNRNITFEEIRKKILRVDIYYKSLSYTKISQDPLITGLDLLGAIGGTFGLFIGASFLSFVEIFVFLVKFCITNQEISHSNSNI
jgi:hypothetical protein